MLVEFVCPYCRSVLARIAWGYRCAGCGLSYREREGIHRFYDSRNASWQRVWDATRKHVRYHNEQYPPPIEIGWPYRSQNHTSLDGAHIDLRARAAMFNCAFETGAPSLWRSGSPVVVDVGSFAGWSSYLWARHAHVVAIDPWEWALSTIDSSYRNGITKVVCDGERLPLADCSVDVVFAASAYHHMADKGAALAEWRRVLVPGGICVATGESPMTPSYMADHAQQDALKGELPYDAEMMQNAFVLSGFEIIKHRWVMYDPLMQYMTVEDLVVEKRADNGIIFGVKE